MAKRFSGVIPAEEGASGSGIGDLLAANNLSDVADAGTSRTNLGVGTGDSPQFAAVNLGHASDTTLTRSAAAKMAVEGKAVPLMSGAFDLVLAGPTAARTWTGPDADATIVTQGGALGTPSSGTLTNATGLPVSGLAAGVTAENAYIGLVGLTLSADGKFCGVTIEGTAGATLAFGDVVYLAVADSRWELADASAASTSGLVPVGICVLAAGADGNATRILLHGTVRADTAFPALTVAAPVYISETAGDLTGTQPTTTDAVIRTLGFALTADSIFFCPSADYITHT